MDHERDAECGLIFDFHAVEHVITSGHRTVDQSHEHHDTWDMNGGNDVWDPTVECSAASLEERRINTPLVR